MNGVSKDVKTELVEIAHGITCAAAACKYLGIYLPTMQGTDGSEAAVIECVGGYLEYLSLRANKIAGVDP